MDPELPSDLQPGEASVSPLVDPLVEIEDLQTEAKPAAEVLVEPSDDFVDLTNNVGGSPDLDPASAESSGAEAAKIISFEESGDEFVDLTGSESERPAVLADVTVEPTPGDGEVTAGGKTEAEEEAKETSAAPAIDLLADPPSADAQQPRGGDIIDDPLLDLLSEAPPAGAKKPNEAAADLFGDDDGDLFGEPRPGKAGKQLQKGLFDEPEDDLFGEPLGATLKKTAAKEQKTKPAAGKAPGDGGRVSGPLKSSGPAEPADIFAEEGVATATGVTPGGAVGSDANGVHAQEDADIFTGASTPVLDDSTENAKIYRTRFCQRFVIERSFSFSRFDFKENATT